MSDEQRSKPSEVPAELFMLLDEDLPKSERNRLMDRLAQSPGNQESLEEVLRTSRLLDHFSVASRTFCPDPETLMDGACGDLGLQKTALFQRHIDVCPLCSTDIHDFRALSAPTSIEIVVKMGENVLESLKNTFGQLLAPAPIPVFRGSSVEVRDQKKIDNKQLGFERQEENHTWKVIFRQEKDRYLMRVSLNRDNQPSRFTSLLFLDGQVIDGRSSRDGAVTIEGLKVGIYELVVKENPCRENAWNQVEETDDSQYFEESVILQLD
jgi:hypothetical protein